MVLRLSHCTLLLATVIQVAGFKDNPRASATSLIGRTPCCADRLSTLTCARLAHKHPQRFRAQCLASADFAFVQCCGSCFDRRFSNSSGKYADAVVSLIDNGDSTNCFDVRGREWCHKFARKPKQRRHRDFEPILPKTSKLRSFWEPWFKQGCEAFPFAFRVCRQSCGFCSTRQKKSTLVYDYNISMDKRKCPPTHAFSLQEELDFDPLAALDIEALRQQTGEYFIVLNHGYEEDIARAEANARRSRTEKIRKAIQAANRRAYEERRIAAATQIQLVDVPNRELPDPDREEFLL